MRESQQRPNENDSTSVEKKELPPEKILQSTLNHLQIQGQKMLEDLTAQYRVLDQKKHLNQDQEASEAIKIKDLILQRIIDLGKDPEMRSVLERIDSSTERVVSLSYEFNQEDYSTPQSSFLDWKIHVTVLPGGKISATVDEKRSDTVG